MSLSILKLINSCTKHATGDATVASVIGELSEIENEPQTDIQE
jgi:hypothetical protein